MRNHIKFSNLWNAYLASLDHALVPNKKYHGRVTARVSSSSSVTKHLFLSFLTCVISLGILLLLISVPVFKDFFYQMKSISLGGQLSFLLITSSVYMAFSVVSLALKNLPLRRARSYVDVILLIFLNIVVVPLSLLYSFQPILLGLYLYVCIGLLIIGRMVFRHYTLVGLNFYLASCLSLVIGLIWGTNFLLAMPASALTKLLILSASPLLVVVIPSKFLHMLELYDVVCRKHWRHSRNPYPLSIHNSEPFVSIQLPTYSEPPDMVIETLNSIHAIEYSNYEVLVIDNNTQDPALWRPVQAHCELLGHKFRFMHIENIKGAKAGALNFAYKYIDPRATIISVLDADYHPSKDFLKSLVGHFQNSKLGFIQTPHDYREWRDNLFLTMCYWEYKLFFHSAMISLNERDAGITVGTMCLVRKETLEAIGGWSEWCVTEDSELAIRVHDAGYSSIYIDKSYGQGLIPDSFEGYKKQRYRWTAGPVQEFRRYYKHFIGLTKYESRFSLTQRIFHLNHGLGNALLALNIPFMLLGIAVVVSMIFQHEIIPVPFELWLTATITLLAAPLLTFLLYRVTIKATLKDIFAQSIALLALSHVIHQAALSTMLTGNAAWNRTNKFKTIQSYRSALLSTKEELSIGFLLLLFTVLAFVVFPYQGLSLMLLIGLGYVALGYFAAPLMAVIGVWSFKREHEDQLAIHRGAAE